MPLITRAKPIEKKVPSEGTTTWVKPKLVAQIKFTEWTAGGEMRHPVFSGLQDRQEGDRGHPRGTETGEGAESHPSSG